MKKTHLLFALAVSLFVLPGLIPHTGVAVDISNHKFILSQYYDDYDPYTFSDFCGTTEYYDDIPFVGVCYSHTESDEGFWAWQQDTTWVWHDIPTDGDSYYIKFNVDSSEEWLKVWYWDGSNWVYKTTITGSGSYSVYLGTGIPSSYVYMRFVDALPSLDMVQSTWIIQRPYVRIYT